MPGACIDANDKPVEWAVGVSFGDLELSLELWNVISGISGFDDSDRYGFGISPERS